MYYIILFLQLLFSSVKSCERGLTQLRQRHSLALIPCVPTIPGQPDPCIVQTGGRMSWCQLDDRDYVCCGSTELLIELLAGRYTTRLPLTDQWRYYSRDSQFDYNVIVRKPNNPNEQSYLVITTPAPPTLPPHPLIHHKNTPKRKLQLNKSTPSVILLSQLTIPSISAGNFSNSLRVSSNVLVVKDGNCVIVVNTGLPSQKNDIIKGLGSAGLNPRDVQFLIITSSHPQLIGNLNLFPDAQTVLEGHFIYKDHVIRGIIEENVHVETCSPSTYMVATPGPTARSISLVAKDVPSMGTVSIVGSLFLHDDSMSRVDSDFTWNAARLMDSRRHIICTSDWIIPAHASPFPVTNSLRQLADCRD